jgi:hypothetical protein
MGIVIDAVWIYMYWDAYDSGKWVSEVGDTLSRDVCMWASFILAIVIRPVLMGLLIKAGFLRLPGTGGNPSNPNEAWKVRNEDYILNPRFSGNESVEMLENQMRESA